MSELIQKLLSFCSRVGNHLGMTQVGSIIIEHILSYKVVAAVCGYDICSFDYAWGGSGSPVCIDGSLWLPWLTFANYPQPLCHNRCLYSTQPYYLGEC